MIQRLALIAALAGAPIFTSQAVQGAQELSPLPAQACASQERLASLEAREDLIRRLEEEFDLELLEAATRIVRRRVTPQTWEAYQLTTSGGLSGAEAADRLGMSVAAVFMAKSSVKGMLQEQIRTLEAHSTPPVTD